MNRIASENICISNTTVRPRIDTYLFDYDSVNEAIVNAIVHNDWSIAEPQISFFKDRIEILSHGGLPHTLSLEDFYRGISKPRNIRLMKIFSDLDIVDHTGHGVPIIIEKYGRGAFEISDNHIIVTIPFDSEVMKSINVGINLNAMERKILELILNDPTLTAEKISIKINKTKRTAERYLKSLQENNNILNLKFELLHFLENEFPKSEISTDDSGFLYLENEKLDIVFIFKNGELNVYDNKARGSKHNVYNGSLKKFKQMVVKNKFGWKEDKKQLKVDKKLISKIAKWIYNEGIEESYYGNWITRFDEIADEFNISYDEAISMSDLIYSEVYKYKGVCDIEMYEEDDVLVIDVNYFTDYLENYCGDDD